jgi:hypothetical protein
MKVRAVALRVIALAAGLLVLGAGCSSSDKTADRSSDSHAPTSSTSVSQKPNPIPFDVGERVGLPNGWLVTVAKVHRPYSNPQLPEPDDGREYVAVDITVENQGTETRTVDAAALFELGDSTGELNRVVAVPGGEDGIDGSYAPQAERSGQLVFDVPTEAALRLAMNGPLIGTQHAIFRVDPPTGPGAD